MFNYFIAYDLNKIKDYNNLIKQIQLLGTAYPVQKSLWYLKSAATQEQIFNHLQAYTDWDDALIIIHAHNATSKNAICGEQVMVNMWHF